MMEEAKVEAREISPDRGGHGEGSHGGQDNQAASASSPPSSPARGVSADVNIKSESFFDPLDVQQEAQKSLQSGEDPESSSATEGRKEAPSESKKAPSKGRQMVSLLIPKSAAPAAAKPSAASAAETYPFANVKIAIKSTAPGAQPPSWVPKIPRGDGPIQIKQVLVPVKEHQPESTTIGTAAPAVARLVSAQSSLAESERPIVPESSATKPSAAESAAAAAPVKLEEPDFLSREREGVGKDVPAAAAAEKRADKPAARPVPPPSFLHEPVRKKPRVVLSLLKPPPEPEPEQPEPQAEPQPVVPAMTPEEQAMHDKMEAKRKEKNARKTCCAVPHCKYPFPEGTRFFRFARKKPEALRKAWINAINLPMEKRVPAKMDNLRVCSQHFYEDDYFLDLHAKLVNNEIKWKLKSDAVPSRRLTRKTEEEYQREDDRRNRRSKRERHQYVQQLLRGEGGGAAEEDNGLGDLEKEGDLATQIEHIINETGVNPPGNVVKRMIILPKGQLPKEILEDQTKFRLNPNYDPDGDGNQMQFLPRCKKGDKNYLAVGQRLTVLPARSSERNRILRAKLKAGCNELSTQDRLEAAVEWAKGLEQKLKEVQKENMEQREKSNKGPELDVDSHVKIQKLEFQVERLLESKKEMRRKIGSLQRAVSRLNIYKRKIQRRQEGDGVSERTQIKWCMEYLTKNTMWSDGMLRSFLLDCPARFSADDMTLAQNLWSMSPRTYRFLRSKRLMPLPSKTTLRVEQHRRKRMREQGIDEDDVANRAGGGGAVEEEAEEEEDENDRMQEEEEERRMAEARGAGGSDSEDDEEEEETEMEQTEDEDGVDVKESQLTAMSGAEMSEDEAGGGARAITPGSMTAEELTGLVDRLVDAEREVAGISPVPGTSSSRR